MGVLSFTVQNVQNFQFNSDRELIRTKILLFRVNCQKPPSKNLNAQTEDKTDSI